MVVTSEALSQVASHHCSAKTRVNKNVLSLNLRTESLIRTVRDSEYQTDGAENRKARLE